MNSCMRGANCPYRHIVGEKATVCKHWLRGLCKKGDQCEFLHEYDMSKMPECYFYQKYREYSVRLYTIVIKWDSSCVLGIWF